MKNVVTLIMMLGLLSSLSAQIRGDGNIQSRSEKVEGLKSIDIQFNANIVLDYDLKEELVIQADANVLKHIGVYFENGHLMMDQIKWIEPSKWPEITIGCPSLESVYQGTHSTTKLQNVSADELTIEGNVGKVIAEGVVENLVLSNAGCDVNLKDLSIGAVNITDVSTGKIILNQFGSLTNNSNPDTPIRFLDPSKAPETVVNKPIVENEKVQYIKFKLKNNSIKRHSFYVKGPNGRGGNFSYGFSLLPFVKKQENWSVGTKVYKVSRHGKKELLRTIALEDAGEVLDLF